MTLRHKHNSSFTIWTGHHLKRTVHDIQWSCLRLSLLYQKNSWKAQWYGNKSSIFAYIHTIRNTDVAVNRAECFLKSAIRILVMVLSTLYYFAKGAVIFTYSFLHFHQVYIYTFVLMAILVWLHFYGSCLWRALEAGSVALWVNLYVCQYSV